MDAGALLHAVYEAVLYGIVVYMAVISLIYFVMMVLGYFALRHYHGRLMQSDRDALFKSPLVPRISIIAPAYNEAATVIESVKAMLTLRYPHHEVIVVNDGSTDGTMDRLIDAFRLYRSSRMATGDLQTGPVRGVYESRDPIPLIVVDKANGGKADALNAGLNVARTSLVAVVDADSILEPDALLHVVKPFLEAGGDSTLAAGGIVRVANGCRVRQGRIVEIGTSGSPLAVFQAIEYLRAFLGGRIAYSFLNSLLVISGAFGVFRRSAIEAVGGFSNETVGEDMELVVRLHRTAREAKREYRIVFVPEPVSWTEVPESLSMLNRQRNRWQRGLAETLWRHRRMLLNRRYGVLGAFAMPYFLIFELLGPTVELVGYLMTAVGFGFGLVSLELAGLFFIASIGFGVLLSISALLLEELTVRRYPRARDVLQLFAAAILENFGLRQMLTVWRTKALFDAFRRKREWGEMPRRGFDGPDRPVEAA